MSACLERVLVTDSGDDDRPLAHGSADDLDDPLLFVAIQAGIFAGMSVAQYPGYAGDVAQRGYVFDQGLFVDRIVGFQGQQRRRVDTMKRMLAAWNHR